MKKNPTTIENKILNTIDWENITHNLTFMLKGSTLAGKMEKEADSVFEEALRAAQDETAHKKEGEAKIKLFNQNILASIETYKKDVLPTLKKKVDEFEKDPNINLVLNLARGFARKIEQNEKIKGFHLSITHHFSYLSEYLVTYEENPNPILWSTERIERLTQLVKEGANLVIETSIYYQAEPEASKPDKFQFSLRCSNKGVE